MITTSTPSLARLYGEDVFNDAVMRARLPKKVYKTLQSTIQNRKPLDASIADTVANAMKDWAIEKGATHYCHWFQPMTGITAEKHDSFISPAKDGSVILEFSGKELSQGEPDASSFPSGGLRATFEARGYTAWDCTSPVFVKKDGKNISLFIPCAFFSHTGEVLDKKTPLLRSMKALDEAGVRVLRALGNKKSKHVNSSLGGEQEYFLIDKKHVSKRLDLVLTGRTLFGASPAKGQEKDDHYFGSLHERIASFMSDVNKELWKLGVSAKTQHNEVAPAQYEIAPVFGSVNVALDHNQLTMETLQKLALRHDFVCFLHEKPFAGVNGSGKHNNWSIDTDDGINLLKPGEDPHENMQFLVFLFAVIRAVDKYSKLLRSTVASAGNDHRLGANEAPPAIISIFLGEQLSDIYEQLESAGEANSSKKSGIIKLGVDTLPPLPKDNTDRNRTSPFAFIGNRFEYRMPGSAQSLSAPNFVLNTAVADALCEIADELEGAKNEQELLERVQVMLQRLAKEHKKIIFNGDNYSDDWVKEAEKRGLPNLKNAVDALATITDPENIELMKKHKVLSSVELHARREIALDEYAQNINIEALTMLDIAKRQITPACVKYTATLSAAVNGLITAGVSAETQLDMLKNVADLTAKMQDAIKDLENNVATATAVNDALKCAASYKDLVIPVMEKLRGYADALEAIVDAKDWPLPTYAEMLFFK